MILLHCSFTQVSFHLIVSKIMSLQKMCDAIGKYGIDYKPPSYHDIRGKLLERAVHETEKIVEDFKDERKRTGCSIMSYGWTDRKKNV